MVLPNKYSYSPEDADSCRNSHVIVNETSFIKYETAVSQMKALGDKLSTIIVLYLYFNRCLVVTNVFNLYSFYTRCNINFINLNMLVTSSGSKTGR